MKQVKRGGILAAISVVCVVLAALVIQHSTQAQRPGGAPGGPGGPGGGFGRQPNARSMMMSSTEAAWSFASFELGLANPALLKAKQVFQEQWDEQKKLIKKMEDAFGDRDAMQAVRAEADKLRDKRNEKLRDILLPEKMEKFAKWEEENQTQAQQRRQR